MAPVEPVVPVGPVAVDERLSAGSMFAHWPRNDVAFTSLPVLSLTLTVYPKILQLPRVLLSVDGALTRLEQFVPAE